MCVVAAGIVLVAGTASPKPPAAPAAGPPAGGAELTAAEIRAAQQNLAGAVVEALGASGWTGPDGSSLADSLPEPRPVPCLLPAPASSAGSGSTPLPPGARRHQLSLELTGPAPASAESARDHAQSALLSAGAEMLSAHTPGPGAPPEAEYTFTAAHADGAVVFAASGHAQKLQLRSHCSADPGLSAAADPAAT
ncbi:MAG: hypothetical protein ABTA24_05005 [Arthrobacter sp.]